jgi:hypothetical protein
VVVLLKLGLVVGGCEYHPDCISGPAETRRPLRLGAEAALGVRVRGYTVDVGDVTTLKNSEFNEGVRNLAR